MIEYRSDSVLHEVKAEDLLPARILQETVADDDDDCVICYQTLYRPVRTNCKHAACESCMLHWALTALDNPKAEELPSNFGFSVEGIGFKCPTCRTYTEARYNKELDDKLRIKYPNEYAARHAEEAQFILDTDDSSEKMMIMFGNSHRKVPPTISPHSGRVREHEWTFFVKTSKQDLIEFVHVVLHPSYREERLVTLSEAPFSCTRLSWGFFLIFAGIQLKEGYEWVDEPRAVDSDAENGRVRNRLPIEWLLEFGGNGRQENRTVKYKKVETASAQEEQEEEDLGELAFLMSEAELRELRKVRRFKSAAKKSDTVEG